VEYSSNYWLDVGSPLASVPLRNKKRGLYDETNVNYASLFAAVTIPTSSEGSKINKEKKKKEKEEKEEEEEEEDIE